MSHAESKPDFSNFAINTLSNFDPTFSDSKSESDCSESILVQCFRFLWFFYPIFTLFKKNSGWFFLSILKTESIVMQAMQV